MKNTIIIIVAVIIIGIGAYYFTSGTSYRGSTSTPSASQAETPTQSGTTINIKNFSFNPSTLAVKTGTKVTWVNNDSAPHTITSDSGTLLSSSTLSPGQSFSFTFTNPGTVNYHCNIHPNMKGSVVVTN